MSGSEEYSIQARFERDSTFTQVFVDRPAERTRADVMSIDKTWSSRLQAARSSGQSVFDGALYSLRHCRQNGPEVVLEYGATSYREYVGTRAPSYEGPRANPVGTLCIPLTSDGFVALGRRSPSADVNPGKYFAFGGFFELGVDVSKADGTPDIFACAEREVEEESGIGGSETSMTLLGIVEDHVHCHPEFVFAWPVEQTRTEFLQARWSEELQDLDFVAIPDVRTFLDEQSRNCTCTLVGGLELVLSRSRDQRECRSGAGHGSP